MSIQSPEHCKEAHLAMQKDYLGNRLCCMQAHFQMFILTSSVFSCVCCLKCNFASDSQQCSSDYRYCTICDEIKLSLQSHVHPQIWILPRPSQFFEGLGML